MRIFPSIILKDETAPIFRGLSYIPLFTQYRISSACNTGSPADAEYTGGKGAVVTGLPKYPKYLLLLLFRTDNHVSQFHALIQIQFLCGYPPLPGKHDGTPDGILQFTVFPGQPYCRNMAAASRRSPEPISRILRKTASERIQPTEGYPPRIRRAGEPE